MLSTACATLRMATEPAMVAEGGKMMEEKEKLFCRIFLPLAWSGHIGLGLALGKILDWPLGCPKKTLLSRSVSAA